MRSYPFSDSLPPGEGLKRKEIQGFNLSEEFESPTEDSGGRLNSKNFTEEKLNDTDD